jgi:hypothetical protein
MSKQGGAYPAQQVANNYFDPNNPSANFQVVEDFSYESPAKRGQA